nr:hypothetical protein [Haloferax sp. ATB1]
MRDQLNEYRSEYGVDSPEELAIEQTNQTLGDIAAEQSAMDPETIQAWQTLRRNLAFANAALSIANAKRFVDGNSPHHSSAR